MPKKPNPHVEAFKAWQGYKGMDHKDRRVIHNLLNFGAQAEVTSDGRLKLQLTPEQHVQSARLGRHARLGEIFHTAKQHEEAIQFYQKALEAASPGDAENLRRRIETAKKRLREQKKAEAKPWVKKPAKEPVEPEKVLKTLKQYQDLAANDRKLFNMLVRYGASFRLTKDKKLQLILNEDQLRKATDRTITLLEDLDQFDQVGKIREFRAQAFESRRRLGDAAEAYESAAEAFRKDNNPHANNCLLNAGRLYSSLGRHSTAGYLFKNGGDIERAIIEFRIAENRSESDIQKQGFAKDAENLLKFKSDELLRIAADNERAKKYFLAAEFYRKAGQVDKAVEMFKLALVKSNLVGLVPRIIPITELEIIKILAKQAETNLNKIRDIAKFAEQHPYGAALWYYGRRDKEPARLLLSRTQTHFEEGRYPKALKEDFDRLRSRV